MRGPDRVFRHGAGRLDERNGGISIPEQRHGFQGGADVVPHQETKREPTEDTTRNCDPFAIFLDQRELADRWGISPRSVERWRQRRIGPAYTKVGASVRYSLADIEAYESSRRAETDAGSAT